MKNNTQIELDDDTLTLNPWEYTEPTIINNGRVCPCSMEEYESWRRAHSLPVLIRTRVVDSEVVTRFVGGRGWEHFETCWEPGTSREYVRSSRGQLIDAASAHADGVRHALKCWFLSPSYPEPPRIPSAYATSLRGVCVPSELFADTVLVEPTFLEPVPLATPPDGLRSLRFRLMRALGRNSSTWYQLRDRLACDETRAVRTLERAWDEGLLIRREGATSVDPPIFGLSEKGLQFSAAGRLSSASQSVDWSDDVWVPGWAAWQSVNCPLCGGEPSRATTRNGNTKLWCGRSSGAQLRDFCRWQSIVVGDHLRVERIGLDELKFELDYRQNVTRVFRLGEVIAETAPAIPRRRIREKIRRYALFL